LIADRKYARMVAQTILSVVQTTQDRECGKPIQ
jgi:hypothetical protein